MPATMARILALNDEIERRTGHRPFGFVSAPTPTSERYVFAYGPVESSAGLALARMVAIQAQVESGEWDHWVCRSCPWAFDTEADRDAHELHFRHPA